MILLSNIKSPFLPRFLSVVSISGGMGNSREEVFPFVLHLRITRVASLMSSTRSNRHSPIRSPVREQRRNSTAYFFGSASNKSAYSLGERILD